MNYMLTFFDFIVNNKENRLKPLCKKTHGYGGLSF